MLDFFSMAGLSISVCKKEEKYEFWNNNLSLGNQAKHAKLHLVKTGLEVGFDKLEKNI